MSKNVNCLKGLCCPKCGQEDEITVRAEMWVSLRDDGTDLVDDCGGVNYEDESLAVCPCCRFPGVMKDFEKTHKRGKKRS